jgi:hypothetical protein
MPLQTILLLITAVIAASGVTITLAYAFGVNVLWLGLAAGLAALVVRRWS